MATGALVPPMSVEVLISQYAPQLNAQIDLGQLSANDSNRHNHLCLKVQIANAYTGHSLLSWCGEILGR